MPLDHTPSTLPTITICAASHLRDLAPGSFTHVISIWGALTPANVATRMQSMFPDARLHVAFFDDVIAESADAVPPRQEQVRELLEFGRSLTAQDSLLVHCLAGISRSSASAFSIACQLAGQGLETTVLDGLVKRHPSIRPNVRITGMADTLLGRNGAMLDAVAAHLKRVSWGTRSGDSAS